MNEQHRTDHEKRPGLRCNERFEVDRLRTDHGDQRERRQDTGPRPADAADPRPAVEDHFDADEQADHEQARSWPRLGDHQAEEERDSAVEQAPAPAGEVQGHRRDDPEDPGSISNLSRLFGGTGSNRYEYLQNAPVNISGGSGTDTVVINGTAIADTFIITEKFVAGGGRVTYFKGIEKLEVKLSEDPDVGNDRLLKFLKELEIRDRLAGMTESQILSHFEKSLLDGSNQALLDAILNAPPGFEMLSPKLLKKLKRIRGKHYYPEVVAQLESMQEMNAIIVKMFTIVRAELDKLRRKYLPIYIVEKSA